MEVQKVAVGMDSDVSEISSAENFGFAFNDSNFSDRVLRIEILDEISAGDVQRHKRTRIENKKKNLCDFELSRDTEKGKEGVGHEDGEAMAGFCDEGLHCIKTLHISSVVLAAKSKFFYKLFTNGMKESGNANVTLKINSHEEEALMELLRFMYSNTLLATTVPALLDILMTADKYEVDSCVKHCSCILRNMLTNHDSALIFLELPAHISETTLVLPLLHVAKKHFIAHYKNIAKFKDEMLKLPMVGIEAIFSSDDIEVRSEDDVYDFILKWTRTHYKQAKDRRLALEKHLHQLIRFPFMSFRKLQEVLQCSYFGHELASKCVAFALSYKGASPYEGRSLSAKYVERAYIRRPIKMVGFELPHQHCVVYLELKREECAKLHPKGYIYSQRFPLGQQMFFPDGQM